MARYYADTYVLIEILRGNPSYERYVSEELVASEFNLLELAYALTRDYGKEEAVEILRIVRAFVTIVQPVDEDYVEASTLRIKWSYNTTIHLHRSCRRKLGENSCCYV